MPAIALLSWPLIAVAIFFALGPGRGMIWTLLLGFLFLPEDYAFDLQALPPYDKYSVISLSLILGILLTRRREEEPPELIDPLVKYTISLLILVMFAGMVVSVFDNTDVLTRPGGVVQPGNGIRELMNFASSALILMVPFFLARRWLGDPELHKEFLKAIVILAVLYSFPILFERRISPQLHRWIYGIEPDAFLQHVRSGGFRPMVFLTHGLVVGYFLFSAVLAAVGLVRATTGKERMIYGLAGVWIFLILILSRNTGALLLAIVFAPALAFLSRGMLLWIMTAVVALYLAYPAVQQARLIPNDKLVSIIESWSADRAQSIEFRFDNEEGLLARALERPVFGWGGWGRSRVFDQWGNDVSVTDGVWIIQLGRFGWVGYLSYFGLLTLPLLLLWRRKAIPPATMALAIMTTANMVYLIPNSTLGVMAWMIGGMTVGFLQYAWRREQETVPDQDAAAEARSLGYSRFPKGPSQQSSSYRRNLSR